MNDDTPVKPQRSLWASDATKKVISPDRQLNLQELKSNEPLGVQTEILRPTGQTNLFGWKHLAMVTDLTAEVTQIEWQCCLGRQYVSLNCKAFCPQRPTSCHSEAAAGTFPPNQKSCHKRNPLPSNHHHQQARSVNTSKSFQNISGNKQKPTASNAVADFSVTEETGSVDFTSSHGDIRAVKSGENKRVKIKFSLFHVVPQTSPHVTLRTP
jgi:hypothetical protein